MRRVGSEKSRYDLGSESMNAFVRYLASFPNIDHSFQ